LDILCSLASPKEELVEQFIPHGFVSSAESRLRGAHDKAKKLGEGIAAPGIELVNQELISGHVSGVKVTTRSGCSYRREADIL